MQRFVHRCPCCTYLGCDQEHDYYFCQMGVAVARFGNDPYAVHVGKELAKSLSKHAPGHPLAVAYGIAEAMGLVR